MVKQTLITFLIFLVIINYTFGQKCRGEKSCKVTRILGMKTADCYKLDFHNFPKCLTGDAEVIDLTYNRIRTLSKNDLKKYQNLKILYLNGNRITKIDEDALTELTDLHTLDLNDNAFANFEAIPKSIFQLPSLKNLYLSQNQNINIADVIVRAVPITSPLQYLDISQNDMANLPDLGLLPSLLRYNISGLEVSFSPKDTAGLCNLKSIINDNTTFYFEKPCDCWNIEKWFKLRLIRFNTFHCEANVDNCPYEIPEVDLDKYNSCLEQHSAMLYTSRLNKGLLIGGIVLLIILLIGAWMLYKWRKRKIKNQKIKDRILQKGNEDNY